MSPILSLLQDNRVALLTRNMERFYNTMTELATQQESNAASKDLQLKQAADTNKQQAAEIAKLRTLLSQLSGYASSIDLAYPTFSDRGVTHEQTAKWCAGLIELTTKADAHLNPATTHNVGTLQQYWDERAKSRSV